MFMHAGCPPELPRSGKWNHLPGIVSSLLPSRLATRFHSALLLLLFTVPAWAVERQRRVLHGHVPAPVSHLARDGYLAKSTRLNLAVGLPLRDESALTNLIAELYEVRNP